MKKTIMLLFLAMFAFNISAELHIISQKDKFGYADENGNIVIKPQFTQVTPFVDGQAKVQKGKKWGYINEDGKQIIKIEFDEFNEFNDDGIALVKKGKKWGYIRRDGSFMIKPEWTFIGTPNEHGYVWVSKAKSLDQAGIGLFKNDVQILKPNFRYIGFYQKTDTADYSDGHVFTTDQAKEIKSNLSKLSTSELPYIWFDYGYKRGVLDLNGKPVIKETNYAQGAPSDGMVSIRQYNKKKDTYSYNYIPTDGKNKKIFKKDIVLGTSEPELCHPFIDGSALIVTNSDGCYLIDKTGNAKSNKYTQVLPIGSHKFIARNNNMSGIIDNGGNEIVSCKYADIVTPLPGSEYLGAKDASNSKYGIIDFNGATIIPFEYESAIGALHNKAYVKTNNMWGVVDLNQHYIITPKWEDFRVALNENDKAMWVKDKTDGKFHMIDFATDKLIHDFAFDDVSNFNTDGISLVTNGEKFGAVNFDGEIILPTMISTSTIANIALTYLKSANKKCFSEVETYRFNIYNNPERNKYRLHQTIQNELWDY